MVKKIIQKEITKRLKKASDTASNAYKKLPRKVMMPAEDKLVKSAFYLRTKYHRAKEKTFMGETTIKYLELGNPNGAVLLFLHGFGDMKESFLDCAQYLKKDFRIILPDAPGFGKSTIDPNLKYNLDNYSRWFQEFITGLNLKDIHIMGNSMGGAIAIQLVLDIPKSFQSLTLITTAGTYPENGTCVYDEIAEGNNIFTLNCRSEYEPLLSRVFHRTPYIPTPVLQYLADRSFQNRDWNKKLLDDLLNFVDWETEYSREEKMNLAFNSKLKAIKIPTFVLWGKHDSIFPVEAGEIIAREIENSKFTVFEDCGHCPQMEEPRKTASHIYDFLQNL